MQNQKVLGGEEETRKHKMLLIFIKKFIYFLFVTPSIAQSVT